ncbi:unnamed protein product, partial [Closterium sp. NIES-53]
GRGDGGRQYRAFTLLYSWVTDHPKSSKVTCTMACNSLHPCSLCLADKEHLDEMSFELTQTPPDKECLDEQEDTIVLRTIKSQQYAYKEMESAKSKKKMKAVKKKTSTHFVKSLLWDWEFAKTLLGKTYLAVPPDIMHIWEQGIWLHAMKCLVKKLTPKERKVLLERYKMFKEVTPASVLHLPLAWAYFTSTTCFSASEHRAMMQVLPLIIDLPRRNDVRTAIVLMVEWYKEFIRAEYHTNDSLERMKDATI